MSKIQNDNAAEGNVNGNKSNEINSNSLRLSNSEFLFLF